MHRNNGKQTVSPYHLTITTKKQLCMDELSLRDANLIQYLAIVLEKVEVDVGEDVRGLAMGTVEEEEERGGKKIGKRRVGVAELIEEFGREGEKGVRESYQRINRSPISHLSSYSSHQNSKNTRPTTLKQQFSQVLPKPKTSSPISTLPNTTKKPPPSTNPQSKIRESSITFSPLRIDISLPSLSSEDLDEFKEEKQIIYEIQNDIKVLIRKIQGNHGDDGRERESGKGLGRDGVKGLVRGQARNGTGKKVKGTF